jgi:hypothetical protein
VSEPFDYEFKVTIRSRVKWTLADVKAAIEMYDAAENGDEVFVEDYEESLDR